MGVNSPIITLPSSTIDAVQQFMGDEIVLDFTQFQYVDTLIANSNGIIFFDNNRIFI